jgi:hypothetical protein
MESSAAGAGKPDVLDHPMYRVAHLHGDRWVTLKPEEQHSARQHHPGTDFPDGDVYLCVECEERVVIAPN